MANDLTRLLRGGNPIVAHLPVPAGMSFATNPATNILQLRHPPHPTPNFSCRFRRRFGHLGEIQLADEARWGDFAAALPPS